MAIRARPSEDVASDKSYTVSQVTQGIGAALERAFPDAFWVSGELQGFDRDAAKASQRRWGQVYFELIEKEAGSDTVRAGIKAVLWGDAHQSVQQKLRAAAKDLKLQDGLSVKLLCTVDFYWPRASLQLKVVDVDPNFTLGDMERARRELIDNLRQSGLFDRNRSLPFPLLPLGVGLITSEGSAAYHDFVQELKSSGYAFRLYLFDAHVQGPETEAEVCRGLQVLAAHPEVQVIALTRGGGSRTDLIWFDKEKIAHAVAACEVPVITGIGHEIDLSVADMVAHASRKTPTALARLLIEAAEKVERDLEEKRGRLVLLAAEMLAGFREDLSQAARLWRAATEGFLARFAAGLGESRVSLSAAARRHVGLGIERLGQALPILRRAAETRLTREKERLAGFKKECSYKDPRRLLARGYSLIYAGGKLAKSVKDIRTGEFVEARLADGEMTANVLSLRKTETK